MAKKTKKKTTKKVTKKTEKVDSFDWSKLNAILQYNASLRDAAEVMDCHIDTIANRIRAKYDLKFSEYREQKMGRVRVKLVQKALDMAMKDGNVAMTIFCLKNLCNWSDKKDYRVETVDNTLQLHLQKLSESPERVNSEIENLLERRRIIEVESKEVKE